MAKGRVLFGRRDGGPPTRGRSKAGAGHAQGREYFARAEGFQAFAGNDFERPPKQDESRIGILGTVPRQGFEGQAEAGIEKCLRVLSVGKEADIARQTRGVREQHAQGHLVTWTPGGFALGKSGKKLNQGLVERSSPRWYRSMAMEVVAITLVRLARS